MPKIKSYAYFLFHFMQYANLWSIGANLGNTIKTYLKIFFSHKIVKFATDKHNTLQF
jgi:hypothetical protein